MDFYFSVARRTRAKRKEYDEIFRNAGGGSGSGRSSEKKQKKSTEGSPLEDAMEKTKEKKTEMEHHTKNNHEVLHDSCNDSDGEVKVVGENCSNGDSYTPEDETATVGKTIRHDDEYTSESADDIIIIGETKGINGEKGLEDDDNENLDAKGHAANDITSLSECESEGEDEVDEEGKGITSSSEQASEEEEEEEEEDGDDENEVIDAQECEVIVIPSSSEQESEEEDEGNVNCDINNDAVEQKKSSDLGSHASFDNSDELSTTDTEYDDLDDEDYKMESHDTSISSESSTSYVEEGDEEGNDSSNEEESDGKSSDGRNKRSRSVKHDSKRKKTSSKASHIRIDAPMKPLKDDSAKRSSKASGRKQSEDVTREAAEDPTVSTSSNQVDSPKVSANELDHKCRPQAGASSLKKLFPPTCSHNGESRKFWNSDSNSNHESLSDAAYREKNGEGESTLNKPERRVPTQRKQATLHEANNVDKRRRQVHAQDHDTFKILADSILHKEDKLEKEDSEQKAERSMPFEDSLPLKFRLKDDKPTPAEESENDGMVDHLFADMFRALAYEEIGSFKSAPVDNENVTDSEAEEHPSTCCSKGKHHLVLDEEMGLKCVYCLHIELESKYMFPAWGRKVRESEWKRSACKEENSIINGLNFETSSNNIRCFRDGTMKTVWDILPGVRDKLFHHQQEGFEFLWTNLAGTINLSELESVDSSGVGGCIISHAPGTGKTLLTIVFIESYLKLFPGSHPVIIAPASMLLTWEQEFRKWKVNFPFHNLNNPDFSDNENKAARKLLLESKSHNKDEVRMVKMYSWNKEQSVLGISYSLYEKLAGEKGAKKQKKKALDEKSQAMRKILLEMPGLVVLDEGHTPRNQRSSIWNTLLKLQTKKRIILSGTPFQNNFGELFNTLRLVRPAIANVVGKETSFSEIMSKGKFSRKQTNKEGASLPSYKAEPLDKAIDKLKAIIKPFVHSHAGKILEQNLPGLVDTLLFLNPPPLQKSLINKIGSCQNTFEFEHKVALVSTHPYLHKYCGLTDNEKDGISQEAIENLRIIPDKGVKTRFIMEFVRLSTVMGEKVLIFSQYIHPLDLIKDQLHAVFNWDEGKQVLQMQGKLDQKQRLSLINVFNDPESEAKVMLASTKCCSEGISLIGASRVVLLDVVWNPSVERQAISRAYRLGQKKVVYTYHLMTSGTTEEDKYCRQAEKDRLSELVFSSTVDEVDKEKHQSASFDDKILGEMVDHPKLKDMIEKVIYQPKKTYMLEVFGLKSSS